MMKSLKELVEKIDEEGTNGKSSLDFFYNDLLQFLPFNIVKDYLNKDTTAEEWELYYRPLNRGNVIGVMEQYMKSAWEKCLDRLDGSATGSILHYHTWLWILDDEHAIEFLLDNSNFACYGAPILHDICVRYNWDLMSFMEQWQIDTAVNFIKGKGC